MRRISFTASRIVPILLAAALAGCVTLVSDYVPVLRDPKVLEPLRTSDPAVIRQRFGDLGLAPGHAFGLRNNRVLSIVFYRWVVEGAVMSEQTLKCADYMIGDASCDDWTYLIYFNEKQKALVYQGKEAFAIGRVQPNGSLVVDRPGYANYTQSFNPATGELKMGAAIVGDYAFRSLTKEQVQAMREEQSQFLANLGRKKAENGMFWSNLSQVALAGAQSYAAERQQVSPTVPSYVPTRPTPAPRTPVATQRAPTGKPSTPPANRTTTSSSTSQNAPVTPAQTSTPSAVRPVAAASPTQDKDGGDGSCEMKHTGYVRYKNAESPAEGEARFKQEPAKCGGPGGVLSTKVSCHLVDDGKGRISIDSRGKTHREPDAKPWYNCTEHVTCARTERVCKHTGPGRGSVQ